jgi:hypothetical protein
MANVDEAKPAQAAADQRATALRPRQLIGRERESTEVKDSVQVAKGSSERSSK